MKGSVRTVTLTVASVCFLGVAAWFGRAVHALPDGPAKAAVTRITHTDEATGVSVSGIVTLSELLRAVDTSKQVRVLSYFAEVRRGGELIAESAGSPVMEASTTAAWSIGGARYAWKDSPPSTDVLDMPIRHKLAFSPASGLTWGEVKKGSDIKVEVVIDVPAPLDPEKNKSLGPIGA